MILCVKLPYFLLASEKPSNSVIRRDLLEYTVFPSRVNILMGEIVPPQIPTVPLLESGNPMLVDDKTEDIRVSLKTFKF